MADYKRVDLAPKSLKDDECVIYKPDFMDFIRNAKKRRGVSKLTTISNLRDIFMLITDKYDHTVNPYQMKLNKYQGLPYENDHDLSSIILKIIKDLDLDLINAAVDHEIKNRKPNTELIYYVSDDLVGTSAFIRNGINQQTKTKKKEKKQKVTE